MFESRWKQRFPLLYVVQTGSKTYQVSYSMTSGTIALDISRPESETDHSHPHLVPRLSTCKDILLFQMRIRVTVLKAAQVEYWVIFLVGLCEVS